MQEKKENIADFKKKAMGFLADICTFVCNLAVDALNNPRTLNYYEKNGFVLSLSYFLITSIKSKYMYRVFRGSFIFELTASCSSSLKR